MEIDRTFAVVWAIGFGLLTGFVASSVVKFATAGAELGYTVVAAVVAATVVYRVIRRTSHRWETRTMLYRLLLYFMAIFVGSVVLTRLVWLGVDETDLVGLLAQTAVTALAVAGGLWLSFYGGVESLIDRYTDVDVR